MKRFLIGILVQTFRCWTNELFGGMKNTFALKPRERKEMSEKVLKEKVVFKNRYGEPITFLVRKRVTELKKEQMPVVSLQVLEEVFESIKNDFIDDKLEDDDPICICSEIRHRLKQRQIEKEAKKK